MGLIMLDMYLTTLLKLYYFNIKKVLISVLKIK